MDCVKFQIRIIIYHLIIKIILSIHYKEINMKLIYKIIIIFLAISLTPIIMIGLIGRLELKEGLTEQVNNQLQSVASLQKNRVITLINQNLERVSAFTSRLQLKISLDKYLKDEDNKQNKQLKTVNKIMNGAQKSLSKVFNNFIITSKDGIVIASTNNKSLIGKDLSNTLYFKKGLKENSADSIYLTNKSDLVIYLSGPLLLKNKLIGVAIIESKASNLINLVKDYSGLGKTGETLLARKNPDGTAVYLTPLRFNKNSALTLQVSNQSPMAKALSKSISLYPNLKSYDNSSILSATQYIQNTNWGLVVQIHQSEAYSFLSAHMNKLFLWLTIITILVIILSIVFAKYIITPFKQALVAVNHVASGDLTVSVSINSKDERGDMLRAISNMILRLNENIKEIINVSENLASSSEQLNSMASSLSDGSQKQAASAEQTTASTEELSASIKQVSEHTLKIKENSQKSLVIALDHQEEAQSYLEQANTYKDTMQRAVDEMNNISKSTDQIREVVKVINDIADQTKLLSLNAAIEAARAGDHGRGFAVVAEAISSLATNTAESTKEIENIIKNTTQQINQGVQTVKNVEDSFDKMFNSIKIIVDTMKSIVKTIEENSSTISEIAQSMEEQLSNSEQIQIVTEEVNNVAQSVSASAEEMTSSTYELQAQAEQLNKIVQTYKIDKNGTEESKYIKLLPKEHYKKLPTKYNH